MQFLKTLRSTSCPLYAEIRKQTQFWPAWSPGFGHHRERLDFWHLPGLCVVWDQPGGEASWATRENSSRSFTTLPSKTLIGCYIKVLWRRGRDNLCRNLHRCQPKQKWLWVIALFSQEIQLLWNVRLGLLPTPLARQLESLANGCSIWEVHMVIYREGKCPRCH